MILDIHKLNLDILWSYGINSIIVFFIPFWTSDSEWRLSLFRFGRPRWLDSVSDEKRVYNLEKFTSFISIYFNSTYSNITFLAMKYMIRPLESYCIDFLVENINRKNAFTILQFCVDCEVDKRLMEKCMTILRDTHWTQKDFDE